MIETISFKKELDDLREAGFTEQQVQCIWKLALRLSATIASKAFQYGAEIKVEPKKDCPWR